MISKIRFDSFNFYDTIMLQMGNNKGKAEAQATVQKKNDKYYDLSEDSLVKKGKTRLSEEEFLNLFKRLRLRFSLTPSCNLWCAFCSNEGSTYTDKFRKEIDIDKVIKLSEIMIKNTPLKSIDFSGGEPTIHSDFTSGKFRLVKWTKKHPDIRFSIHSNGILLKPKLIDEIKDNFSRIGISLNGMSFEVWNKITNSGDRFPEKVQRKKYKQIMENIDYLAKQNIGDKVFIKSVIMKGINDSEEELETLLDLCAKNNFHPKFLEFEPQYKEQEKYVVGRKELFTKLKKLGCSFSKDTPWHNDPNSYIPGVNFEYRAKSDAKIGLHSIFGCGDKAACESCYLFLCMFVKPTEDGKGLYLKPCSTLDTRFDLTWALEKGDEKEILELFKLSREYLMLAPGLGIDEWNKEEKYRMEFM